MRPLFVHRTRLMRRFSLLLSIRRSRELSPLALVPNPLFMNHCFFCLVASALWWYHELFAMISFYFQLRAALDEWQEEVSYLLQDRPCLWGRALVE